MTYPKLKGKRVEKGYTQQDIADKLGISVSAYNLKEQGKRQFIIEEICEILNILDCKFEDIFIS